MRPSLRRSIAVVAVTIGALAIATAGGWLIGRISHKPRPVLFGEPVTFSALPTSEQDDLIAFFRAFTASCGHRDPAAPRALERICAEATGHSAPQGRAAIHDFLAARFVPRRLTQAFFTGYFEPVVEASPVATAHFKTPLLAPPPELVNVRPGVTPGLDPVLTAARREPGGSLVAMPDRAGIETGALGAASVPIAYVKSPLEAFFIQVQGSARLKMPDGSLRRLVYAGRNGYPYTAIGRILVTRYKIPPAQMGMAQLKSWIREHGQDEGEEGTRLMRENRSFIFFRFDRTRPPDDGPLGAQGVGLTPLRSLAIDHGIWPYGLPFSIDTLAPDGTPIRRLMVGQDTGAAIKGAARADIFFGTGDAAGAAAGDMRANGTLYVLWPKEGAAP